MQRDDVTAAPVNSTRGAPSSPFARIVQLLQQRASTLQPPPADAADGTDAIVQNDGAINESRCLSAAVRPIDQLVSLLPRRWEQLGDVLLFRLPVVAGLTPLSSEEEQLIACAIADALPAVRVVALEDVGPAGELRVPIVRPLLIRAPFPGDPSLPPTTTVHREGGCRYQIDVCRVMFASGNGTERMRVRSWDCRQQRVVDMFSGIGYFTLPLAWCVVCRTR